MMRTIQDASVSTPVRRWTLTTKLAVTGGLFLSLALASIALTLWVTWRLEGGAAAVNEAGRMRMQTYRLALTQELGSQSLLQLQVARFQQSLQVLKDGDPSRPLFVPWDAETRRRFAAVQTGWTALSGRWAAPVVVADGAKTSELADVDQFVGLIDAFVSSIERQLAYWTAILNIFQMAMMVLAIGSAVALMYAGYLLVLNPVGRLQRGLERIGQREFDARVDVDSNDEFGVLADGFNQMAETLQSLYQNLEAKVQEKTARLEAKQQQLGALYEISAHIAEADTLDDMAQGFAQKVRRIADADAVAVRWSDEAHQRYWLLASDCLPESLVKEEACVHAGDCHCGPTAPEHGMRVIPIQAANSSARALCAQAGYQTVVSIPVNLHQRCLGEVDLFYRHEPELSQEQRALMETMASHLAGGMESMRAASLEREAAVAEERSMLARELHDSIAQSLAFMKIQVQLLRDAVRRTDESGIDRVIGELDEGLKESYSHVRELLLHFRTRTNAEDIEPALRTTLQKFEHQTGLKAHLSVAGHGLPLPPDVQIQVLHVVQESLSNIRKHAHASEIRLTVTQEPQWQFVVQDNGCGFDPQGQSPGETHVGLHIMAERAHRIGAELTVQSLPGKGTTVTLTLPLRVAPEHLPDVAV